ncbi:MAG: DEAD/DEAH box helicase [Gammaproteobacteria bacterium]|jgi:ATP-dependent RNA helicase RhlB|nr:DEAD/DEAH box helicase [Gammaproteobacteria bacterium]
MTDSHLSDIRFDSLALPEPLARGIKDAGFVNCTPIQAETLPLALRGKDVAGQAQTGTGKTAAFLLALYNRLLTQPAPEIGMPNDPRAIIIAPTRELALQIEKDAVVLGKHTGLKLGVVFGGTGYDTQRQMLADGVDVLVGTPGRIIDYYKQRIYGLDRIQVMVLDEADRMFDLGFIKDIRFVLRRLPSPEKRLSMLFSATLGQRVLELAYEHMNSPELIQIESETVTADRVTQVLYYPSNEEKLPLLIGLLRSKAATRTMVFVNTKRAAERIEAYLIVNGIDAKAISGDVPQRKRMAMLKKFQEGELPVLIGTDVASRGLHIPGVSHVVNYDLPQDCEDYVHRIGRTARAGERGDAISFGCEQYVFSLPDIEKFIGQTIPVESVPREILPEKLIKPGPEHFPQRKPRPGGPRKDGGGRGGPRRSGGGSGGRGR